MDKGGQVEKTAGALPNGSGESSIDRVRHNLDLTHKALNVGLAEIQRRDSLEELKTKFSKAFGLSASHFRSFVDLHRLEPVGRDMPEGSYLPGTEEVQASESAAKVILSPPREISPHEIMDLWSAFRVINHVGNQTQELRVAEEKLADGIGFSKLVNQARKAYERAGVAYRTGVNDSVKFPRIRL